MSTQLGSPADIGPLRLKNRFIQSPLHPMLADAHGHVTSEQLAYYQARAFGGAALCISEYAFIDHHASRANVAQLSVADDHCIPGLARLAETIQQAGALAGVQVNHCGRQRFLGVAPIVAPSPVPWPWLHSIGAPVPRELSIEEIDEIAAAFGKAARRVRDAGFNLVELHAGHGYLVGQFLSSITNRRADLYGGDLESRQRFLRDVIRAMRRGVGDGFPITVRLSGIEGEPGGITIEETVATAQVLENEGVAAIDISAGNHHTMDIQVQPMYVPPAANSAFAREVKASVGIPVSVVGSIVDAKDAEEILRRGDADFVRLGRPLLADPNYPRKVLEGRSQAVRPCIRANECLDRGVAKRRHVVCAVNYRTGREATSPVRASVAGSLHVAIVGGGPAGIEAATAATEAGLTVTLYERDRLGGALNDVGQPPFKRDLLRYRDYLVSRAHELPDLREGAATAEELASLEPDVVIVATGARPAHGEAIDLRTALSRPEAVGEDVVVEGGGQFAAEVAWELARVGHRVTIAAPGAEVADDVGQHTSGPLRAELSRLGVEIWFNCARIFVDSGVCRDGGGREVSCDTLVTSAYVPCAELLASTTSSPWRTLAIGDCVAPRRIYDAVTEANRAILNLSASSG
jgi:2,4-dienoyl-CoA reductase-like NADH-dependent reductase (Old Yellow Enzyme family)